MPIIPCLPNGPMNILPLRIRCRLSNAMGLPDGSLPVITIMVNPNSGGYRMVT